MSGVRRYWIMVAMLVTAAILATSGAAGTVLQLPTSPVRYVPEWIQERALLSLMRVDPEPEPESGPSERGFVTYVIEQGDTLWSIARRHDLQVSSLTQINKLANPHLIRSGQQLLIPPRDGILYRVEAGDTAWEISRRFNIPTAELVAVNEQVGIDTVNLQVGERVFVPGVVIAASDRSGSDSGLQALMVWPVRGRITSGFGPRWGRHHDGIDIAAPHGTNVRAAVSGKVTSVGWRGGYGRTIILGHDANLVTLYAHLSSVNVRVGQQVQRGEVIGQVGSTGLSTGPHLHFEVHARGRPQDPIPYLEARN